MSKKLICPKCDYENREGTQACLICSTDLKGQKKVSTSPEQSSDKPSTTSPNPAEELRETIETPTEEENLKELIEKPSGQQTAGDESSPQKKRRKISPIRIMIYILLAGYWIWFGMTQCGVDKTTS